MRVLVITQRIETEHDILGFFVRWVEALARRVERVEVIAQHVGTHALDPAIGVRSLGKEDGVGRFGQWVRLQRHLAATLTRRQIDVVLCHMCPEYVLLCAPAARLAGVPVTLWYTHGTSTTRLRWAVRWSRRVLTASLPEFPVRSGKVLALGHGIDTQVFAPSALPTGPGRTIVSVGRISPVKDHALVVRGFARVLARTGRDDLRLRIVGGPPRPEHAATLDELRALVTAEGLGDRVEFVGAVPHPAIGRELASGHVLVSASRTGSLDKAVLEAMACARPVLVSNPAFRTELSDTRLRFREGDEHELADKLEALIALSDRELETLASDLARSVVERHDLAGFADRLRRALVG